MLKILLIIAMLVISSQARVVTVGEYYQQLKHITPKQNVNIRTLIKHIREFYISKGSENALKFLFRIMFGEKLEIPQSIRNM